MAIRFARGRDGGGAPVQTRSEKRIQLRGGLDPHGSRVRDCPRAIFEADWHLEAAGHLLMGLGFGGAGSDRGPANRIRNVS